MNTPAERAPNTVIMTAIDITPARQQLIESADGTLIAFPGLDSWDAATASTVKVWLGDGLTDDIVSRLPELAWVQATSQGVEKLLQRELVESEALVTNVQGMHAGLVADHTMGLVLALARSLPQIVRAQVEHEWVTFAGDEITVLDGSRMVIIGTGKIGRAVATRAKAFGIHVTGINRTGSLPAEFDAVLPLRDLVAAAAAAKWLVIATPLTAETTDLVDETILAALPGGAFVVNVGRGPVVNSSALKVALRSRHLGGAALDVLDHEPLGRADELWDVDNLLIAPHTGGLMPNYLDVALQYFAANLTRFREGQALHSLVNKSAGY